jgi:hypothetical protein
MPTDTNVSEKNLDVPPLVRLSAAFLLASAMFGVAAIVAFGTYGRNTPYGWGFAVFAGITLGAWFLGRSQGEKLPPDQYSRQRTMLGINAVSTVLLFLVLLVGVNYIATRRHKTFDLTKTGVNSLAPQSYTAIDKLPSPVQITYVYMNTLFSQSREPNPQNRSLLEIYQNYSDKVHVTFVDAAKKPSVVKDLKLTTFSPGSPQVLVELSKDGKPVESSRQILTNIDEQNITSALMKVTDSKPKKAYLLTGHGEANINALGGLKAALEAQNYQVDSLSFQKIGASVPPDASVIIVPGPRADLSEGEFKLLTGYLGGKGHLVLFWGPEQAPSPKWTALVKSLGLTVKDGVVADVQQAFQDPTNPVGALGDASAHPLLRGVSANTVFPETRPMTKEATPPAGVTVTPLFETSTQSGEVSGQQFKPGGPYVLAAAVEKGSARAVVVANDRFATNDYLALGGNQSFLQAAVNWCAGNDALVSIPPKPPVNDTLTMPDATARFVALFSLLVLPFGILALGTFVWWRRR